MKPAYQLRIQDKFGWWMDLFCVKVPFPCLCDAGSAFLVCSTLPWAPVGMVKSCTLPCPNEQGHMESLHRVPFWIWCEIEGQKSPNVVLRSGLERYQKNGFKICFTCPKLFCTSLHSRLNKKIFLKIYFYSFNSLTEWARSLRTH